MKVNDRKCAQRKELSRNSDPASVLASDQQAGTTTNGDDDHDHDDDDDNDDDDDDHDDDDHDDHYVNIQTQMLLIQPKQTSLTV